MMDPSRFQITGPLKPHVEHVWTALLAQGYTPLSGANLVRLMAHLSRWLEGLGLQAYELTNPRVADFLVARQEAGYSNHLSRQGLEPILELLQTAGVVSALEEQEPEASERERLFNDYAEYLVQERGVVPMTVLKYQSIARNFLSVCIGEDKLELSQLRAGDVSGYIVRQSRQSSVNWTKYTVTALRSILHFLYLRGELATELDGAVGTVAAWRQTSLPKALPAEQVQRLVKSCDRRTHLGRRNFAIMLLLARFGLRAGEVAALELDDFHWAQGEFVIRGKGRENRLPLPCDVGEAVVAYIGRGRPQTSLRKLFLSNIAPLRAISGCAVRRIVRRACTDCGLAPMGAHRLRHSAATEMLRQGGSLTEIAQVLGHRSVDTTAIYAKVDRLRLREVVQPWPEGGVS